MDFEQLVQEHAEAASIIEHLEYTIRELNAVIEKYDTVLRAAREYVADGPDLMDEVDFTWSNLVKAVQSFE